MNPESIIQSDEFKKKLFERLHGISSKFKIPYPINPKISYEYPKIDPIICQNIINCLVKYPKFYQQTLHLMNKMNLPCPLFSFVREPPVIHINLKSESNLTQSISSTESEIESETEICTKQKRKVDNEPIETKKIKVKSILKSMNLANTIQNPVDISQVFEKQDDLKLKTKTTNVPKNLVYDRVVVESETGFSKIIPTRDNTTLEEFKQVDHEEIKETNEFIKKENLESNRLKLSELRELPVFKNYDKGDKNSRIYLKNLSKKVSEQDLRFIYGRYVDWSKEEQKNAFDIRLMKEGRMKGQAFINLPNDNLAEKAINETLGYMLDEKPIIVQFARSAKPVN